MRSDTGDLICGGFVKLPNGTNNDAEFAALLGGLRLCKEDNLLNIDIEGDSLNVIRSISSRNAPSWKSRMWVNDIQEILEGMDFSIKHVFREANQEADFLSNHVIDQANDVIISNDIIAWTSLGLSDGVPFSDVAFDGLYRRQH
ncbi:hypothetical protein SUGI_0233360 [Cryptomeria japonica]|nr:hypothetical protein SUGI_0233360 [Cryptomeria japonica]